MTFFSKLINSFKSLRLNDKNAVTGQSLNYLLIGSMYAEQQSAYLNSYETGLSKSIVNKLVKTYWEIPNKEKAIEVLQNLLIRNKDKNVEYVYQAFEDKENYVAILKSNLPKEDKEGVSEYYLDLYRTLNNVIPELIEQNIITDFSQLKKTKDSAWNYGRGVFLSRCCYELDYLSEKELQEYIEISYKGIKNYCTTWKEYTISYMFGRAIWGANNQGMAQIADDLLNNEKSPLKNKTYL